MKGKVRKLRTSGNSDIRLQTVEIQMRRLLMSRLIRCVTVCLVNLFIATNQRVVAAQRQQRGLVAVTIRGSVLFYSSAI